MLAVSSRSARVKTRVEGLTLKGELRFGSHMSVQPGSIEFFECATCERRVSHEGVDVDTIPKLVEMLKAASSPQVPASSCS